VPPAKVSGAQHPRRAASDASVFGTWLGYGDTVAKSLFDLTPPERLKRFRELAVEAREFSETMNTDALRDRYLKVADHWAEMADQLEQEINAAQSTRLS